MKQKICLFCNLTVNIFQRFASSASFWLTVRSFYNLIVSVSVNSLFILQFNNKQSDNRQCIWSFRNWMQQFWHQKTVNAFDDISIKCSFDYFIKSIISILIKHVFYVSANNYFNVSTNDHFKHSFLARQTN